VTSKRKARRGKSARDPQLPKTSPVRKWRVRFEACDVAREHDGFLRGRADPAFIIAAFESSGERAQLVGRSLLRVVIPRAPGIAPLEPPLELRGKLRNGRGLLVVIALEEDDGADVERLYASLSEPARFCLWRDASEPAPEAFHEIASSLDDATPARVGVLFDQVDLSKVCRVDSFVGAAVAAFAPTSSSRELRLHTRSEDGRSDWTLLADLKLGG
jgi:hypothetical protein